MNLLLLLAFFSLLCKRFPCISISVPAFTSPSVYAPSLSPSLLASCTTTPSGNRGRGSSSYPVLPSDIRTNRFSTAFHRWLPARKLKHPFVAVASSSAYQNPTALGGSVNRNVLSWCGGTRPPISGCLQITILCRTTGLRKYRSRAIAAFSRERVTRRKGGDRSWRAWPILLMASSLGLRSVPCLSKASGDRQCSNLSIL
jgi:hypothetical protein